MTHTSERATSLLHAHPNLHTTVEATIADVEEDEEGEEDDEDDEDNENEVSLQSARDLLARFPIEVQHAATKLQLSDSERMWATLNGTAKSLTRDVAALTQENESLRLLLADAAGGEKLAAALAAGLKAANARRVSLVAVKREGEGGEERRASKRARK